MIAYPFRFRCKQPPRLFLGFATTLHREKQGKAIAIREHGQEAPRSYFVRPL